MHHAIQAELNFVRLRTDQGDRLKELASALAGPNADPDFNQDLIDLTLTLDQHLDQTMLRQDALNFQSGADTGGQRTQAYQQAADLRKDSPLIGWLLTFQSPSEDSHQHALQLWSETKTLPWLTAAIAKSTSKDAAVPELLEAAARLAATSPAYTTVTLHRARLLIALDRQDEARALLDTVLPEVRKSKSDSATNAFLGLRMQTARTLAEFLTYAPRKMLEMNSQAAGNANCFGEAGSPSDASCKAKPNCRTLTWMRPQRCDLVRPVSAKKSGVCGIDR